MSRADNLLKRINESMGEVADTPTDQIQVPDVLDTANVAVGDVKPPENREQVQDPVKYANLANLPDDDQEKRRILDMVFGEQGKDYNIIPPDQMPTGAKIDTPQSECVTVQYSKKFDKHKLPKKVKVLAET